MKNALYFFCFLIISISCNQKKVKQQTNSISDNIFHYAKNIYSQQGSNKVTVFFTWEGQRDSIIYSLVQKSKAKKLEINEIAVPISNIAAMSTTDIAMIDILGKIKTISGVTDPFRISNKFIIEQVAKNTIKDLGTSMDFNQELLVALNPEIVITTAFSKTDFQKNATINALKIPIVYTMSWQEENPLARAEWIKLLGMLYNIPQTADSVFSVIEHNYLALQSKTKSLTNRPEILAGDCSKDVWYMPGGKSYLAQFIADAGGDFLWKDNADAGSVPVSFEQVILKSKNTTIWIGCDANSYKELAGINKNYMFLNVYKKQQIYNRNKRRNGTGGNDYWETGYVRPDFVLADFIAIIHPELLPNHELLFYKKLN